jgi:hypothetical protein
LKPYTPHYELWNKRHVANMYNRNKKQSLSRKLCETRKMQSVTYQVKL